MRLFPDEAANVRGKYKASLLLPKNDALTWRNINDAIADAIGGALKKKWSGIFLESINMPIKDGDGTLANGAPFNPECAGHYVIFAHCSETPDIVDMDLQPITDTDEIYDGIFAHCSITFFAYLSSVGTPSIGCILGPIMKVADGDYIPYHLSPVEKAFSGIVGLKPHQKPIREKQAATENTLIANPLINEDAPPQFAKETQNEKQA